MIFIARITKRLCSCLSKSMSSKVLFQCGIMFTMKWSFLAMSHHDEISSSFRLESLLFIDLCTERGFWTNLILTIKNIRSNVGSNLFEFDIKWKNNKNIENRKKIYKIKQINDLMKRSNHIENKDEKPFWFVRACCNCSIISPTF